MVVVKDEIKEMIVVNATALDQSGALSILEQFVRNIPYNSTKWLIFISDKIKLNSSNQNIRLQPIRNVKSLIRRFKWDFCGLNNWLKKNNIKPIATISLQNTNFRISEKNIPRFIYYHQSIPFYSYKWNITKNIERSLWFYKNIYPFFVKLFLKKDDYVFVQLNYIKKGFSNHFSHPESHIGVYSPTIEAIQTSKSNNILNREKLNIFYPSTYFPYKNHQLIIDALNHIKKDVDIYFTISQQFEDKRVKSIGTLPYVDICNLYENCDVLVFPSYIETFGLPLIEGAMAGIPIITVDLPYAHEVLEGYGGVIFLPYNKPRLWAEAINNIEKGKRYAPIDISTRKGWNELFKKINSTIKNKHVSI